MYAKHRMSTDHDHVLADLRNRFDVVLAELESVAGWKTARVQRPVLILGSLDGIQTGVRQLIRDEPLETVTATFEGQALTLPSPAEILRIKAVLILKRNATRDYLDFIALTDHLGSEAMLRALSKFDALYPQSNGASALLQLQVQLANPVPFDLEGTNLAEYKHLDERWHDWSVVKRLCRAVSTEIFDYQCDVEGHPDSTDSTGLKPSKPR